jgi:hypothetical protein
MSEDYTNDLILPGKPTLNEDDAPFIADDLIYASCMEAQATFNRKNIGHVYILGSTTGYYKIGRTNNLAQRLRRFEVALPFKIWLELDIAFWDCVWAEKYFHALFCNKRVNGEWFKLNYNDLIYIQNQGDVGVGDSKLKVLLNWANLCPWTEDFVKNGLGKYNPLPAERGEILSEYDHNTSLALKQYTNFRSVFYDKEPEDFPE